MASGKGTGSKMVVWGLLALLIVGLGGFGATNFGGSVQRVGAVGNVDVTVNQYGRALQNELRALSAQTGQNISVDQAQALGIPQQVLNQLLNRAALNGETMRLGISVGDAQVAQEIRKISSFQGIDGKFDSEAYKFALSNNAMNTRDFEAEMRSDISLSLVQGALATGITMPPSYAKTVIAWAGERRRIDAVTLTLSDLETPLDEPTEADLQAQYEATPEAYTLPQTRDISYAWITPAMLSDQVDLDEDALRALYDANISQYVQPERRLVEQLVYGSAADAQTAADRIASGETTFEDEVAARGLELADVDMGDVGAADLGDAGADVFAADVDSVVGPVNANLGPALFRVNGVLPAVEIPYDEARADLSRDMALDAARREISDLVDQVDDLLAGGATLEELGDETVMELGRIDWSQASEEGIASYTDFADAAASVTQDDFPEVIELSDGGIFALRLNGLTPATLQPLDTVRDDVIADWEAAETDRRLKARAEELQAQLAEGATLADTGLEVRTHDAITRQDYLADEADGFVDAVFAPGIASGDSVVVPGDGAVTVAQIAAVLPPDADPDTTKAATEFATTAAQGAAQDVIAFVAARLRTREQTTINQAALTAVHAQLP